MSLKNLCISYLLASELSEERRKLLPIELSELLLDIHATVNTVNNEPISVLFDIYFEINQNEITDDTILSQIHQKIEERKKVQILHKENQCFGDVVVRNKNYDRNVMCRYCYQCESQSEVNSYYLEFHKKWVCSMYGIWLRNSDEDKVSPNKLVYVDMNLIYNEGNFEYISMQAIHTSDTKHFDPDILQLGKFYQIVEQMSRLYISDPLFHDLGEINPEYDPRFSRVAYTFIDGNDKYTIELPTYYPIATRVRFGKSIRIPLIDDTEQNFYICRCPQIAKILEVIPIKYIYSITSSEVVLKESRDKILAMDSFSYNDLVNIFSIYHPTIIKINSKTIHKLYKGKYKNLIKLDQLTVLFEIHTFYDKYWIMNNDKPIEPIGTKYLYIQIDDTLNEYGCLDDMINKILNYFNSEIIIVGRKKSRLINHDIKFTVTYEKFNNLIIFDE